MMKMNQTIDEKDPLGLPASAPGAKLDAGKPKAGLVVMGFADAIAAVIDIGTFGANKYSEGGWSQVPDGEKRYTDAMIRHLLAEKHEATDKDSGLLHAAHLAWNALARLQLMIEREV